MVIAMLIIITVKLENVLIRLPPYMDNDEKYIKLVIYWKEDLYH